MLVDQDVFQEFDVGGHFGQSVSERNGNLQRFERLDEVGELLIGFSFN